MKISVIIPSFNMGSTLQRAIDSALPQAHEVLVVDDASTDDTPAVLDTYRLHPKVKRLRHAKNKGVVASRNAAIATSSASWFLPLDADDKLADNVLPLLSTNANSTTFVYGDWLEVDADSGFPVPKQAPPIGMIDRKNVAKATFLFSRTMFESVGGYDADFEATGGEDWAFMLALVNAGFKGVRLEIPIYHYESGKDGRAVKVKQNEAQVLALFRQKYREVYRAVPANGQSAKLVGGSG